MGSSENETVDYEAEHTLHQSAEAELSEEEILRSENAKLKTEIESLRSYRSKNLIKDN